MRNNWFKDMEKITICIGAAIIYLGFNNLFGYTKIDPALVTGISLSGLCLTIADFLSKEFKESKNKKVVNFLIFFDFLLYILAAMCILSYPNTGTLTSLDKDTLDKVSTGASVIALGVVFMAIGLNNRRSVLEEERRRLEEEQKRLERMQEILERTQKVSQKDVEQNERTMKLLTDMSVTIKDLEKEVNELKSNTVKSSV
ncbi:hypothetical protein [Bacillus pseudomycoides]|uniref:hypothetical protein n=1 Tax=Bacillus pseudomycoides TaxID=64104 RepID=UPI000BF07D40|nr:hypothetical protein [Bacillus pseudomycoides]PEK68651.1 hypothetical protein CN593_11055 [Bacillus pseudomycoides]PFY52302.1 hypothetical protein COL49_29580 [Bacillus pseudomycoides]PGE25290.1 hypothetical protein COM57_21475 [Bacillus pseudomycoides]